MTTLEAAEMSPIMQEGHERALRTKKLCLSIGAALAHAMSQNNMNLADVDAALGNVRPGTTSKLIGRLLSGHDISLAKVALLAHATDCRIHIQLSKEGAQ